MEREVVALEDLDRAYVMLHVASEFYVTTGRPMPLAEALAETEKAVADGRKFG
ncbi:MAG: hypothetical protein IPK44_01720 [Candidatus Accumulibacter sp.]|uniref:hypothetical protein n=1 Tax=Accumulibacter sp. TaxID=2053492 RepID=UPI002589EBB9|nr:hypothetical protein [Accumulibacter sp.]MBK8113318.1 hypothetical protein [Accumulibacter sp.]